MSYREGIGSPLWVQGVIPRLAGRGYFFRELPTHNRTGGPMVLLFAATIAASAQAAQTVQYDVYYAGVRVAELTSGSRTWSIRKRDPASARWTAVVSRPSAELPGDTAFALWG